jgi:CheY-like chemotaxis protein
MFEPPFLFFPTFTLFIDDYAPFMRDLSVLVSRRFPLNKTFSSQEAALEYIREFGITSPFSRGWRGSNQVQDFDEIPDVKLYWESRLFSIHKRLYDANRFASVATVVVDYQMPGMNGIEFCKAIKNPFVKKILLTGVADSEFAIEALSKGWIDHYVSKHDPEMIQKLMAYMELAQNKCFRELANSLLLEIAASEATSFLSDPSYQNLIGEFKSKTKAVEYYPCDTMGSMVFVNAKGDVSTLGISTKEQMDLNYELASQDICCSSLSEELKKYEKMIFCSKPEGFLTSEKASIGEYVYTAHKIEGRRPYYYAFEPLLFDVDRSAIRSYNVFLDENEDLFG